MRLFQPPPRLARFNHPHLPIGEAQARLGGARIHKLRQPLDRPCQAFVIHAHLKPTGGGRHRQQLSEAFGFPDPDLLAPAQLQRTFEQFVGASLGCDKRLIGDGRNERAGTDGHLAGAQVTQGQQHIVGRGVNQHLDAGGTRRANHAGGGDRESGVLGGALDLGRQAEQIRLEDALVNDNAGYNIETLAPERIQFAQARKRVAVASRVERGCGNCWGIKACPKLRQRRAPRLPRVGKNHRRLQKSPVAFGKLRAKGGAAQSGDWHPLDANAGQGLIAVEQIEQIGQDQGRDEDQAKEHKPGRVAPARRGLRATAWRRQSLGRLLAWRLLVGVGGLSRRRPPPLHRAVLLIIIVDGHKGLTGRVGACAEAT